MEDVNDELRGKHEKEECDWGVIGQGSKDVRSSPRGEADRIEAHHNDPGHTAERQGQLCSRRSHHYRPENTAISCEARINEERATRHGAR
jgi:hypothetical protein